MLIALQILACALSLFALIYPLCAKNAPASRYWPLLAASVLLLAYGSVLEFGAHTADALLMALRIQYAGLAFYPLLLLLYTRERAGCPPLRVWLLLPLLLLPALTLVFVNLYPHTQLFFRSIQYETVSAAAGRASARLVAYGALFYVHALYGLSLAVGSLLQTISAYTGESASSKKGAFYAGLFAAIGISCACLILLLLDSARAAMAAYAPIAALSMLLFALTPQPPREVDLRPYAHDHVIANMQEGYILLDGERRLRDANAVALRYFPDLRSLLPGGPIASLSGFPHDVLNWPYLNHELPLQLGGEEVKLRMNIVPIHEKGRLACTCIMLYDVTQPQKAESDPLAEAARGPIGGILGYGAFLSQAALYFDLLLRMGQPAVMMTLEIDNLTRMREKFGQATCDEAARVVASILKNRLRRTDLCGRLDRARICAFLPATDKKSARRLANQLRGAVEAHVFQAQADPLRHPRQLRFFSAETFRATVSVGLAQLDNSRHFSLDDLIADVDTALYMAKDAGRNTVIDL